MQKFFVLLILFCLSFVNTFRIERVEDVLTFYVKCIRDSQCYCDEYPELCSNMYFDIHGIKSSQTGRVGRKDVDKSMNTLTLFYNFVVTEWNNQLGYNGFPLLKGRVPTTERLEYQNKLVKRSFNNHVLRQAADTIVKVFRALGGTLIVFLSVILFVIAAAAGLVIGTLSIISKLAIAIVMHGTGACLSASDCFTSCCCCCTFGKGCCWSNKMIANFKRPFKTCSNCITKSTKNTCTILFGIPASLTEFGIGMFGSNVEIRSRLETNAKKRLEWVDKRLELVDEPKSHSHQDIPVDENILGDERPQLPPEPETPPR